MQFTGSLMWVHESSAGVLAHRKMCIVQNTMEWITDSQSGQAFLLLTTMYFSLCLCAKQCIGWASVISHFKISCFWQDKGYYEHQPKRDFFPTNSIEIHESYAGKPLCNSKAYIYFTDPLLEGVVEGLIKLAHNIKPGRVANLDRIGIHRLEKTNTIIWMREVNINWIKIRCSYSCIVQGIGLNGLKASSNSMILCYHV